MRVFDRIPAGAARNADVFGNSLIKQGEKVISLDVELEDMPPVGLLVLRERAVVEMAKKLGYVIAKKTDFEADQAKVEAELDRLRAVEAKYHTMQEALADV